MNLPPVAMVLFATVARSLGPAAAMGRKWVFQISGVQLNFNQPVP